MPISPYFKPHRSAWYGGGGTISGGISGGTTTSRTSGDIGGVVTATQTTQEAQERVLSTSVGITALAGFYATPAGTASAVQMNRAGAGVALSVPTPFRGSILGIVISASTNKTAGTATFDVYVNGVPTGASLSWPTSSSSAAVSFNMDSYGFNAGDKVDVRVTTVSYTPITAIVEATVFVAYDQSEAI